MILVGSHLLHDQAWKFFTELYISPRYNACHASNILGHLCFHLEEQGEGLKRQDMMSPWLFSGCYWKHCVQHMVCWIVFFPKPASTFSFTMTKQYLGKGHFDNPWISCQNTLLIVLINSFVFFKNIVLSFKKHNILQLTFPLCVVIIETTLFYQVSSQVLTLNLCAGSCLKACWEGFWGCAVF